MKEAFYRLKQHYIHFVEKQGFPIIVIICVAVITGTALFTRQSRTPYIAPTPPPVEHISAAQLLQQSLASAATPVPTPTIAPVQWCAPLDTLETVRRFDTAAMVCLDSGVWSIHDAVDLKAKPGTPIHAIGDGEVTGSGNDKLQGAWLTIQHKGGIMSHYAGMSLINDYIAGDAVRAGDIIGFCGDGPLDEASLGTHLHLRIAKDGQAIDPCSLWDEAE